MNIVLENMVVAIPRPSMIGVEVARCVLAERGDIVMGATTYRDDFPIDIDFESLGRARFVPADLSRPKSTAEFVRSAVETFGRIDVLVIDALTRWPPTAERGSDRQQEIQAALRPLLDCLNATFVHSSLGNVHVVLVSSDMGQIAFPVAAAYLGARLASADPALLPKTLRLSIVTPPLDLMPDREGLGAIVLQAMTEPTAPYTLSWVSSHQPSLGSAPQLKQRTASWAPAISRSEARRFR